MRHDLNKASMSKMKSGSCQQFVDAITSLAAQAHESNAATAKVTLDWDDGSAKEGEYVPEIIFGIRMVGASE